MTNRTDLPLARLLESLAGEIAAQARTVEGLHSLVERAGGSRVVEAQAIDSATQHLEEISRVLLRVVETLPEDLDVPDDVLSSLGLSDLRDRLAGRSPEQAKPDSGEMELF